MKIKISPSLLEQFRLWRAEKFNINADRIRNYILGEFKWNDAMSRGSAYHALLEHGGERYKDVKTGGAVHLFSTEWDSYEKEVVDKFIKIPDETITYRVHEPEMGKTWTFSKEAAQPALDLHEGYKKMTHEVWSQLELEVDGYTVFMRIKMDGIDGLNLHEFKTTGSAKKALDYYESIQWKVYLAAQPELADVTYHIFQLNKGNTKCKYYSFTFPREQGLIETIRNEISVMIPWLEGQGDLLPSMEFIKDYNPYVDI